MCSRAHVHPASGMVRCRCHQGREGGKRDVTREQLRDIPGVDSLYFTMLNHNKRSVTLDTKSEQGKRVLEKLVKHCDVLVENFAPGALDRMDSPGKDPGVESRHDRRVGQGFGPGPTRLQGLRKRRAMRGGSASTTGFDDGPPLVTGAQIAIRHRLHLALGIVTASINANRAARTEGSRRHAGRRVEPVPRQAADSSGWNAPR